MQFLYFYRNKKIFTLVILLFISFGLMFLNIRVPVVQFRRVLFFISYPFELLFNWAGSTTVKFFTSFRKVEELEKELSITKERLIKYQELLLMFQQLVKENEELKKLLEIRKTIPFKTFYARITFRDPSFLNQIFVIDKGAKDGIKANMCVVSYNENGEIFLVGKVIETSLFSSKVKVLNASDFYIGVTFEKNRYIGIMKGGGIFQNCVVNYIPVDAQIDIGENVLTSGESEIFPGNIKIGKVVAFGSSVRDKFFKKVYVRPELVYSKIRDVFVILESPAEKNLDDKVEKNEE
ncbi:MAG: rod shape-determining protein MreC [Brevinematia bacterium]